MKKLLGVLLAIAMSWPVSATVLKNVEVVGEIQTIASDVRHQADFGDNLYNSGAWTRAMAGLSADLVEDVTANFMFQYAYMWGENNKDGEGFSSADGVKLVNASVTLHNLFCAFDLTVGRQFYGDEDSAVMYFGPNHYNAEAGAYAQALDAAKLTYGDDTKAFTFIAGKIADDINDDPVIAPVGTEYVKAVLMGADFKYHFTEALMAQVYGYNVNNWRMRDAAGVEVIPQDRDNDNVGLYGIKLAGDMDIFRASAEYARNYGGHRLFKEHKNTGHMFKADIAADIDAFTARGAFLYANEDFWAFGNYTPGLLVGHVLGGSIWDYTFDTGIRMFNVGFDMKAAEKWIFSLDGFAFQGAHGNHAATWEADLTAKYNHNEYVQLFAGFGYAKYGNDMTVFSKAAMNRKDNVKGQLGMLIKF